MSFWEKLQQWGNFMSGRIVVDEGDKESFVYRAFAGQTKLKEICLNFYRQVGDIRSNTRMTAEGHSDEIKKAGMAALRQLDAADKLYLQPVQKRLAELQLLFKIKPMAGDVCACMREIEIRSLLLTFDSERRYFALKAALETQDEIVFSAFHNAPSFLNLVNPELLKKCRAIWLEQKDPRTAKELAELEIVSAILSGSFAEAFEAIGQLGQITDDSLRSRLQTMAQRGLDQAAERYKAHRLSLETTFDIAGNPTKPEYRDTAGNPLPGPATKVLNTGD